MEISKPIDKIEDKQIIISHEQQKKLLQRLEKQRLRHKKYYNNKKKQANVKIKEKCAKIFDNLDIMGATRGVDELDDYIDTFSNHKFKCKCFDLLFDINETIED